MKERFRYIGAVYLFLIRGDKILLQRRFQTGYKDGDYGVPSGHLDGNETIRQGCAREIKEEIGIDVLPSNLSVVHTMHRNCKGHERFDFFMTVSEYDGEVENKESHKCDDLSWFPISSLPSNIVDYVQSALGLYQQGIHYSEHGWE